MVRALGLRGCLLAEVRVLASGVGASLSTYHLFFPIDTPRPYLPTQLAASVGVLAELDQLGNMCITFASVTPSH